VTIVVWQRQEIFGQIQGEKIQLSSTGEIVWQVWEDLPRHFRNITLGSAVVMPNHFHGIIIIEGRGPKGTMPRSLGAIIQNFKSVSSRKIARVVGRTGTPVWQRNYFEQVVRNEDELWQMSEYVLNNPLRWETDNENPHV
jgi:putative transposase